ncbi:hypothetical protein EBX31_13965, partial [bacterium]|nr:hypothetical protein [bacterium]
YPFYSPSQLAFISTDYGSNYNANPMGYWTNRWPTNSVFGNNSTNIPINRFPGNLLTNASIGFTNWNDQAAEEWFAKIYRLATTQSRNYRCYVLAQLVETNGKPKGPVVRKYFNIIARNNALNPGESISASTYIQSEAPY